MEDTLRRSVVVSVACSVLLVGLPSPLANAQGAATQTSAPVSEALARCPAKPLGDPFSGPNWNGWGNDVANSRFQTAASARLTAADVPKLTLKWALGFPDGEFASSQPTVVGGRVYVGVGSGAVYAFDAETGCVYWRFPTHQIVRTSIIIARLPSAGRGPRYAAFFGDLQSNVYAVDAETGTHLWTKRVDMHPQARLTATPTFYDGRLYVPVSSLEEAARGARTYECCTFRGKVVAYDAATGQEVWRSFTIDQEPRPTKKNANGVQEWAPAGGAVWNSPTIDAKRGVLYVGTGNSYTAPAPNTTDAVYAFDLKSGLRRWVKQVTPNDAWIGGCNGPNRSPDCPEENGPDYDFGQSPILHDLPDGRSLLLIGQKSGVGYALDPDKKGAVVWQQRIGKGSIRGGMQFGSAIADELVYFSVSDQEHGPDVAGGIAGVRIATGEKIWYTRPPAVACAPPNTNRCMQAQGSAVTAIPGVVFSGASNGMLRAYSTADGKVLWEFDTAQRFTTLNTVPARGGPILGSGVVIVDGVVYATSGHAELRGGVPGNVLLAFSVARTSEAR
jgi:polyvinyl alcohol dehydrogenase (cytochrome)